MLLKDFIETSTASLSSIYPEREARGIVELLYPDVLGIERYTYILHPEYEIPEAELEVLRGCMDRLLKWEPVQYIVGHCEFYSRTFNVAPGVLIPRPETEMLVQWAVEHISSGQKALDLCTGSGCIAWSIALEVPGAKVTAVDISRQALEIARAQFQEESSPEFLEGDVLGDLNLKGDYDLLVSNPPYIAPHEKAGMRPNVLNYEPEIALFAPEDNPLIFYQAIARHAMACLKPGGMGIVEINENFGESTLDIFKGNGLKETAILKDLAKKDRFITFQK